MEYLLKNSSFASSLLNFVNFRPAELDEVQLFGEASPVDHRIDNAFDNRLFNDALDYVKEQQEIDRQLELIKVC